MQNFTFGKALLAALLLAVVVLLLVRENPDLDAFGPLYGKERFEDPTKPPECPDCGAGMELRYRHKDGEPFWGCKRYPGCHGTREWGGMTYKDFKYRSEEQYGDLPEEELFNVYRKTIGVPKNPGAMCLDTRCPECYSEMRWKTKSDKYGNEEEFLRCSRYPHCRGELHWEEPETDWEHPELTHVAP